VTARPQDGGVLALLGTKARVRLVLVGGTSVTDTASGREVWRVPGRGLHGARPGNTGNTDTGRGMTWT
jgi:hypothetical protein